MKYLADYVFCSERLVSQLDEIKEVFEAVERVPWTPSRAEAVSVKNYRVYYQQAYNRLFEVEFSRLGGWTPQPVLCDKPELKGDFLKNDVFVEIQFGNSATIFRDYYKFHLGLVKKLLSLAVLIIPTNQYAFFPDRRQSSIRNMATFDYACEHLQAPTIPVPVLLIGLLPSNSGTG